MENTSWIVELLNNFGLPIVMIVVFIVGIVYMFKHYTAKDEKHDAELKEMTEKYYESYIKVTESNAHVTEALNNNTRVIEKLLEKLG